MWSLVFLIPLVAAASPNKRIVGGSPVDIDDYGWQVRAFLVMKIKGTDCRSDSVFLFFLR